MLLSLGCGKLKGLRELMRTLNVLKGEVNLDTKHVGRTRLPTRLMAHGALTTHLMCPLMFCPYIYGLGSECCFFTISQSSMPIAILLLLCFYKLFFQRNH